MAIVDAAYYYTQYMGTEAAECEFPRLEARAEDVIGAMTRWRASADTIASLPAAIQTLVKKAICAQIDFFAINGLDSTVDGANGGRGWTVGKVSVSGRSGSELTRKGVMSDYIAPQAIMFLEQTGLMNPNVPVAPDMPLVGWWL